MARSRKKFFTAIRAMAVSQTETMAVVMMQAMVNMAKDLLGLCLSASRARHLADSGLMDHRPPVAEVVTFFIRVFHIASWVE